MKRPLVTKTPTDTTVTITFRDKDARVLGALAKRHQMDEGEVLIAAYGFLVDPDKALTATPEKDEFGAFVEACRENVLDFED